MFARKSSYNMKMVQLKVKELKSLKDKTIGLINAKKAYPVLIKTRFGIHTFGLKFAIDVLILNKENQVVKLVENLKPNRIFLWNPIFYKVIELPAGIIKEKRIRVGDKITFYKPHHDFQV